MNSRNNGTREYKKCYIAYLDLLGFKNILNHYECESVAKLFEIVEEDLAVTVGVPKEMIADYELVHRKIMSDSICFYVDATINDSLISLIATCNYFQLNLLRHDPPILARGAIVKGDLFHDEVDIMFGKGFVEAYQLEENVAKYPRIIMTRQVFDSIDIDGRLADYVKEIIVEEEDRFCSIDYLYLFYALEQDTETWKRFTKKVERTIGMETNMSIREKYLYLDKQITRVRDKYMERYGNHLASIEK